MKAFVLDPDGAVHVMDSPTAARETVITNGGAPWQAWYRSVKKSFGHEFISWYTLTNRSGEFFWLIKYDDAPKVLLLAEFLSE